MITIFKTAQHYFRTIFILDARSLGIMRIGVGLISIYNLIVFYPSLELFFGPFGVLPIWELNPLETFSLHALSDNMIFIHCLFALHLVFSAMLLAGYKTHLATIACWIMTVSLFNRAPGITFGGDDVLKPLLMWSMFLPLGQRYSVDAIINKDSPSLSNRIYSWATAAFILQLIIIYLVNGFGKTDPLWERDFSALQYILNDKYAKPAGTFLLKFPDLLLVLTFATLYLERFGTILLFFPSVKLFRIIAIILFITFHLCIEATMKIGWFTWIMISYWLALIPRECWQRPGINDSRPEWKSKKIYNQLCVILLGIICISNYYFLQKKEIKVEWQNSSLFKIIHFLAIDQKLLKFMPVSQIYQKSAVTPVFEHPQTIAPEVMKKYTYVRTPYFRTGRILYWHGPAEETLRRHQYLKRYLVHYWSSKFPDGPRAIDATITLTIERILPYENKRIPVSIKKY